MSTQKLSKKSNRQKLDSIYRQETIRTVGVVVTVALQLLILSHQVGWL